MSPLYIFMDFLSRNIVFTVFSCIILAALLTVVVLLIVYKVRARGVYDAKKKKKEE